MAFEEYQPVRIALKVIDNPDIDNYTLLNASAIIVAFAPQLVEDLEMLSSENVKLKQENKKLTDHIKYLNALLHELDH